LPVGDKDLPAMIEALLDDGVRLQDCPAINVLSYAL
jgi:hypothetical protein